MNDSGCVYLNQHQSAFGGIFCDYTPCVLDGFGSGEAASVSLLGSLKALGLLAWSGPAYSNRHPWLLLVDDVDHVYWQLVHAHYHPSNNRA